MPALLIVDYDSPISENGTLTEKYYLIAEMLRPFSNGKIPCLTELGYASKVQLVERLLVMLGVIS